MFEIKHLKTIRALNATGSIKKAAEQLFTSQSALSHQIKDLEQRIEKSLFIRNTQPLEFTQAGEMLLALANTVIPEIEHTAQQLKAPLASINHLKLAIACHACFQWLLPITSKFNERHKNLTIEYLDEGFFNRTQQQQVDILFTDVKTDDDIFNYAEIGQFEVIAVMAKEVSMPTHSATKEDVSMANKPTDDTIQAIDFKKLTLLTYPLPPEQLDIFSLFLNAQNIQPKAIKQVKNSHVMLQMAAANMGVAVLPDWLVNSISLQSLVTRKRLGSKGIYKTLYARYANNNYQQDTIKQLIPEVIKAFQQLKNAVLYQ
ncbi:LysR family transcriptional regulator [Litorilituus lipolyticus]|uniref:LysR family transcriptional regulator n=1 Tax=Litorilituus lipolyticus TaxID=2491017 RepID=A0A502L223_9GAMM|nr:LysR family transcriptional regulator [Litorilituus lipolyticus]TPH17726.1 LysR family transcriptional regulator [Litorilituus lipolyticus]